MNVFMTVIQAGIKCYGCGKKIVDQEPKPMIVACADHNEDHAWCGASDCPTPILSELVPA